jgi:hypothetical protein
MCHIFVVSFRPTRVCLGWLNIVLGSHDWWTDSKVCHDLLDCSCPSALNIVFSVTIDPNLGGCTRVQGGVPAAILSAGKLPLPKMHIRQLFFQRCCSLGYIGSTLLGAGLMLGGFDILAAKICSFVIGIGLIMPLVLVRDKM